MLKFELYIALEAIDTELTTVYFNRSEIFLLPTLIYSAIACLHVPIKPKTDDIIVIRAYNTKIMNNLREICIVCRIL